MPDATTCHPCIKTKVTTHHFFTPYFINDSLIPLAASSHVSHTATPHHSTPYRTLATSTTASLVKQIKEHRLFTAPLNTPHSPRPFKDTDIFPQTIFLNSLQYIFPAVVAAAGPPLSTSISRQLQDVLTVAFPMTAFLLRAAAGNVRGSLY